jgi:hypothetical protein
MKTSLLGTLRAPAGALVLGLALLAGCGGGSGSSAPAAVAANKAPAAVLSLAGQLTSAAGTGDAATYTGAQVQFDASGSTDPDGDTLTFSWTLTSKPATSSAAIKASGSQAVLTPDVAGSYVATVRITDSRGAFTDKQATLTVTGNAAPVTSVVVSASYSAASATAARRSVTVGASILLDGSASRDADGDVVTTTWELMTKPAGSRAALAIDGKTARLNTDVAGTYSVRARGTDPSGAYSETIYPFDASGVAPQVVVVSSVVNGPVDAGGTVVAGTIGYTNSLSSISTNTDGATLAWTLVSKPATSSATLGSATGAFSQITPDVLGNYVVRLLATLPSGVASTYTTTIAVNNRQPLAAIASNATPIALPSGPTLRLPVGTTVTLRGTGSSDADGDVLTTDKAGSYVVSLRVTDTSGAYSVQTMTVASGNAAPVAVVSASRLSTIAGTAANLNAGYSFDDDGDALTYTWALDARPATSTATISASTAQLAFTPDVAGTYVASVTVSDGKVSSVGYVTVTALSSTVTSTRLPFTPLISRYSKGVDKYVAVSAAPNLLNIVDPFTGTLRQVPLPGAVKEMTISPDGKLAVALHEGTISVVDLENTVLLRSSATNGSQTEAFINNAGLVYLTGNPTYSSNGTTVNVINGRTGVDMTATLSTSTQNYYFYGAASGVYSSINRRAYIANAGSSSEIYTFSIDANNMVSALTSSGYRYDFPSPQPFFLNTGEDLLFSGNGNFFRTATMKYAGKLVLTNPTILSLSQSDTADEAVVMTYSNGTYDYNTGIYSKTYEAGYHRFTSSLYYAAADIALPVIGAAQSYGVGIYHSANSNQVALVQTGGSGSADIGLSYFLVTR